jgi:post-segregation antitoxin (ccd killing protein)
MQAVTAANVTVPRTPTNRTRTKSGKVSTKAEETHIDIVESTRDDIGNLVKKVKKEGM